MLTQPVRANVSNLVKSIKQQCFTIYETVQLILKHEIDANTTKIANAPNLVKSIKQQCLPSMKQFNRF